jgi:hypothetical protein
MSVNCCRAAQGSILHCHRTSNPTDYKTLLHTDAHSSMRICSESLQCGHSTYSVGYICVSRTCNWSASAHYDRMIDRIYGVTHRQIGIDIPLCVLVVTRWTVVRKGKPEEDKTRAKSQFPVLNNYSLWVSHACRRMSQLLTNHWWKIVS